MRLYNAPKYGGLISLQVEFIARHAWIPFGHSAKRECIQSSPPYDGYQGGAGRYDHARQIKEKQDAYCEQAFSGRWSGLGEFPEDLQWEALVDVLRGRVKVCHQRCFLIILSNGWKLQVQTHCYEAVDLDDLIRVRAIKPAAGFD